MDLLARRPDSPWSLMTHGLMAHGS